MKKVEISIELPSWERSIMVRSLEPESGRTIPKTQINISETNAGILLTIEAETTNALRAALNSYMRWFNCIHSIATGVNL